MKWRGFRHPSPDPTDLRLHRPVRDCWTDWIPRTGASDTELANALRRIEGTRNAIGASPVIAQQYADECSAFLHLHHEALIARLSAAPSEGSAPINYQSADSRLIVESAHGGECNGFGGGCHGMDCPKCNGTGRVTTEQVPEGKEVRLFDSQWVNIVNHDNCWCHHTKEDAIHEAVRMTEAAIAKNVADGNLPDARPINSATPPASSQGDSP